MSPGLNGITGRDAITPPPLGAPLEATTRSPITPQVVAPPGSRRGGFFPPNTSFVLPKAVLDMSTFRYGFVEYAAITPPPLGAPTDDTTRLPKSPKPQVPASPGSFGLCFLPLCVSALPLPPTSSTKAALKTIFLASPDSSCVLEEDSAGSIVSCSRGSFTSVN